MNVVSDNGAFLILLLFGAFFVGVHAFRLYGEVHKKDVDQDAIWMDGKVQLVDFVGRRAYIAGFICYLVLLELLFLIFSSSSVILEMALSAVGNSSSVGALESSGTGINPWAPVLASSAVIAITEVKPFSQIEHAIRRVAHNIAGIPRRLRSTIDLVYAEVPDDDPRGGGESDGRADDETGKEDSEEAGPVANVRKLRDDILTLKGWVRCCPGSVYRHGSLHFIREQTLRQLDSFDSDFRRFVEITDVAPLEKPLDVGTLRDRAVEAKRQLVFHLALLIVKSDPSELPRSVDERLRALMGSAGGRRDSSSLFNALALSTVSGFALALGTAFLYYLTVYVVADFEGRHVTVLLPADVVLVRALAFSEYILFTTDKALVTALWEAAATASIFLTSSLVAIGVMLPKIDRGEWKAWNERESVIPHITTGALAIVITYPIYLIFLFLKLVIVPTIVTGDTQRTLGLMSDFGSSYLGYSLVGLAALPCAMVTCRFFDDCLSATASRGEASQDSVSSTSLELLSDRRLSRWSRSVLVVGAALVCGLINLLVLLRMQVLTSGSDAFRAVALPALTFACLLGACARYTSTARTLDRDSRRTSKKEARVDASAATDGARDGTERADERVDPERSQNVREEHERRGDTSSATLSCLFLSMLVPAAFLAISPSAFAATEPVGCESAANGAVDSEKCQIVVGVRTDARPFSYLKKTLPEEDVLAGFGGYMIEICRSVLRDMLAHGPFEGVRVVPKVLEAKSRFPSLRNGSVDMLCGPDSVTEERLDQFYVSHPVFLSGMTYGYVDPRSRKFPRSAYCGNVVGVVSGTTAESAGLKALDRSGLLLRFDRALALELRRDDIRLAYGREALVRAMKLSECFKFDEWEESESVQALSTGALGLIVDSVLDEKKAGYIWSKHGDEYQTINRSLSRAMSTEECPAGFSAMPVKRYNQHDEGIADFCAGKVLYYLGDYDILTRRVEEFSGCEVRMNRFTSSRELYGIFFPAGESEPVPEAVLEIVEDECKTDYSSVEKVREERIRPKRALFYAEFNTTLLRMMQGQTSLLEEAFAAEFGEKAKSEDLAEFFDSLKIVEPER